MNLIMLDYNSYCELVKKKNDIVLGVFNENCDISKLFIGILGQLSRELNKSEVYMIEKTIFQKLNKDYIDILPQTLKIKHQKIENISYGFKSINIIKKELKLA